MKKLIVMAAIAIVAGMTQAAQLKWGSGSLNMVDDKGNMLTTAPSVNFALVYLGTGTANWDSATKVQLATFDIGEEDGEKWASFSGKYTGDKLAEGAIFGIMIEDDKGALSMIKTDAGATVNATFTVSGFSTTYNKSFYLGASGVSGGLVAVPEPTSGLLMLLGLAGLALKRKRT